MISLKTAVPGPKSSVILRKLKAKNGGWFVPYPLVHSGRGKGVYCEDIDRNIFLDFASQVATNPLGYNYPELVGIVKSYNQAPVKFAGQDFSVEEHLRLIENLVSIAPKKMDSAFLINSGAEAVENAIKICMRSRPGTKFGISMEGAFHGRTIGALSLTGSKAVQKKGYLRIPTKRLPYTEKAGERLERIIEHEASPEEIGFVIIECVQGEGGYRIAPDKMVKGLRKVTKKHRIPLICDEVQSGMGRTGKWWAFQNFGIEPEVFTSAKALQVGAVVSSRRIFPKEPGALSSTWGGGGIVDLALGMKIIEIIKKEKLLARNRKTGSYLLKGLRSIPGTSNHRGLGLMTAFDLPNPNTRDNVVIECIKNGLIVLGCGKQSIRMIPPYIIERKEIDEGLEVMEQAVRTCRKKGFSHRGKICQYMDCVRKIQQC